jgi:hypothetical protein
MTIITIIVPLVAFALAVSWMIRQGNEAKKKYLRLRQSEEQERVKAVVPTVGALPVGSGAAIGGAANATAGDWQQSEQTAPETTVGHL